jgi:alpha-amylase
MQFFAALLSTVLNLAIVAIIGAVLFLIAEHQERVHIPSPGLAVPGQLVAGEQGPRTVLVQLFEWRWNDIAAECETFLGPRGFRAVQVSPPNEHRLVAGHPWWQRYEPVSYLLQSRSGDATAFAEMVRRCADAGVAIYADVVINHMTGRPAGEDPLWGKGSAGSRYDFQDYPDYGPADFHQPYCEIGDDAVDRTRVQRCALSGRADLDTEADRVQNRIGAYLNRLLDLGVAGFRIDAAKHMAAGDIAGILARVRGLPYVYQEVLEGPGEAVSGRVYLGNGAVTEFDYARRLAAAFRSGNIALLETMMPSLGADDLLPSDRALVFVDSHDAQRGHGGSGGVLTYRDAALYDLANVFMLAWPYGTPRAMSGYRFADPDAGPPSDEHGNTRAIHGPDGLGCGPDWLCEHRRPAIAAMVGFRNATNGAPIDHWWQDETGSRIAFGRGERGFVVINNADEPMQQWLRTGLPPGRYCNALTSEVANGVCAALDAAKATAPASSEATGGEHSRGQVAAEPESTGKGPPPMLEVSVREDQSTTVEVPPRGAVAIHVELRPDSEP